jgi:APA family basic amino acid/polyamine antiporter
MEVDSPLPSTFDAVAPKWSTSVLGCATAISSAQLVLVGLFAQPRIFFRMARDGLLASPFGKLHNGSPLFGTVFAGVGAGLLSLVMELDDLAAMISIGTLMAFSTVCAGVVTLRYQPEPELMEEVTDDSVVSPLLGVAVSNTLLPPARKRNHAVWWLVLYTVFCLALGLCLRHRDILHVAVPIFLAILCLVPPVMISRLPQPTATGPPLNFMCPLVPWLPCLGIFVNVYLLASQEPASYIRVAVWTTLGMANYFFYGISHSILNWESQTKEAVQK